MKKGMREIKKGQRLKKKFFRDSHRWRGCKEGLSSVQLINDISKRKHDRRGKIIVKMQGHC